MQINNSQFTSIEQVTGKYLNTKKINVANEAESTAFGEILKQTQLDASQESSNLKFSKHANERIASRSIDISENQMQRLLNGAKQANEKGINESLVIVDNLAFIVNVKNNTVITAMDQSETAENVYTNIDGAVII
ncbi:flagellar operon protein [Lachnotalea glycerini]|uniref:Flagellar operon protein n=1 Tax=Lachnotalea glycerini TaxID=1763509 RepID=A0A255I2D2_9FIRM|nr:TIGR02530 family flagellar biosynthesis protein [Lachnotalea glycerini]OYP34494.1 flagellar protein [Lachnotalea glycerini]PXV93509.1 flagellar operon protein [Lachnotalea glycerini]RDY32471.1 flagellar protein [Lachnotalea glycerini]